MRAVVRESKGRSFLPAHFVLVDKATGAVVHHKLGPPGERGRDGPRRSS